MRSLRARACGGSRYREPRALFVDDLGNEIERLGYVGDILFKDTLNLSKNGTAASMGAVIYVDNNKTEVNTPYNK